MKTYYACLLIFRAVAGAVTGGVLTGVVDRAVAGRLALLSCMTTT